MKLILSLCLLLISQIGFAREYQLGVVLGAPTGISGKMELEKNKAVDAVVAYSLEHDRALEIHSDYLIENAYSFNIKAPSPLELYYGIGGRLIVIHGGSHDGDLAFGPRAPIGVNYKIVNPNVEFFGELALAFDVVPETSLYLEGGIGIRYRF